MNNSEAIINEILANANLIRLEGRLCEGSPPNVAFYIEFEDGVKRPLLGAVYPPDAANLLNRKVIAFVPRRRSEDSRVYIFHRSWSNRLSKFQSTVASSGNIAKDRSRRKGRRKGPTPKEIWASNCREFFNQLPYGRPVEFHELANGIDLDNMILNRLLAHLHLELDNRSMTISYESLRRVISYICSDHMTTFLERHQQTSSSWPVDKSSNSRAKIIYTPLGGKPKGRR